jgi:hypothetical protein
MKKFCSVMLCASFLSVTPLLVHAGTVSEYQINATHQAYLGSCDAGRVQLNAYKGKGYVQMDTFTIRREEGIKETLYAVDRTPDESDFLLVSPKGERMIDQKRVLNGLHILAPNTFALIMNSMNSGNPTYAIRPTDCALTDADIKGEWIKIPR